MTPRQLQLACSAFSDARKTDLRLSSAKIYSLASLIRTAVWGKKMPAFDRVFPEENKKKVMSDEELYEQVRALNKLFGGLEI